MDPSSIDILRNGTPDEVSKILKEFNTKHTKSFSFPDISSETKQELVTALLTRLETPCGSQCHALCLETLRIVSREKSGYESLASERALTLMTRHAGLSGYSEEAAQASAAQNTGVIVEAQKCVCNIIFSSQLAQKYCSSSGIIEGIIMRLKTYKDPQLLHDIKLFDMRILFLLTALCQDVRPRVWQDLHGLTYLIEVLDLTLRDAEEKRAPLGDQDVFLSCEILKILFNLTVSIDKQNLDEEEEAHFMRLVSVLHDMLVVQTASKDKQEDLQSHTVNLLTNMPADSYEELLTPMMAAAAGGEKPDLEYDGKNMEAVQVLLSFLKKRLESPQRSLKESLTPILHCLCECCRANRCIRKFSRLKVLPYLKNEVMKLPEEGNSLRNQLCKLLTCVVPEVKDLAADFMFILCKENVARFVKYTGYGNAAGLLAQRGLMRGGRGATVYESESEDSETEEYSELKDMVNAVTGQWEEDKPDPLEGMSEEQKEYEAMQIVNKLDKLTREGILQPVTVGADGKPKVVEDILEMREKGLQQAAAKKQGAGDD